MSKVRIEVCLASFLLVVLATVVLSRGLRCGVRCCRESLSVIDQNVPSVSAPDLFGKALDVEVRIPQERTGRSDMYSTRMREAVHT